MKKILVIITSAILGTSSVPNISNLFSNSLLSRNINLANFSDNNPNQKSLDVPFTKQEEYDYCAPSCIYSIFAYRGVLPEGGITQEIIFNENDGIIGEGVHVNQNLVNYINNGIHSWDPNQNYEFHTASFDYLRNNDNFATFNAYIVHSLTNHCPVLIGYSYFRHGRPQGHAVLITGIILDDNNINNTQYILMDPFQSSSQTVLANDLFSRWDHVEEPLEVAGAVSLFNFEEDQVTLSIPNNNAGWNGKFTAGNREISSQPEDLTESLGILNSNQLVNTVKKVLLPNFTLSETWGTASDSRSGNNYISARALNGYWMENWSNLNHCWWAWYLGVWAYQYVDFSVAGRMSTAANNDLNLSFEFDVDCSYSGIDTLIVPSLYLNFYLGDTVVFQF